MWRAKGSCGGVAFLDAAGKMHDINPKKFESDNIGLTPRRVVLSTGPIEQLAGHGFAHWACNSPEVTEGNHQQTFAGSMPGATRSAMLDVQGAKFTLFFEGERPMAIAPDASRTSFSAYMLSATHASAGEQIARWAAAHAHELTWTPPRDTHPA
jgi:hypothetical protein